MTLRRLLFCVILAAIAIGVALVFLNLLKFLPASSPDLRNYLSLLITTESTVGGISFAVIFLTSQLWPLGPQSNSVVSLYRSSEFLALISSLIVSIVGLLVLWPLSEDANNNFVFTTSHVFAIFGLGSIILLIPAVMLQVENLDNKLVAIKLAERISPRAINQYGLSHVFEQESLPDTYHIKLRVQAIDYNRYDPLRPMHEIIQNAIEREDRLELGKLHQILLSRILAVHGLSWNGVHAYSWVWNVKRKKHKDMVKRQLIVALHILHYCVRHAKNLKTKWRGIDVGRHSLIYNLCLLMRKLNKGCVHEQMFTVILGAIWEISIEYQNVEPYGRIEPLNILFEVSTQLSSSGRFASAERAGRVLGGIYSRTSQISKDRTNKSLVDSLPGHVLSEFNNGKHEASMSQEWTPFEDGANPWQSFFGRSE